MGEKVYIPPDTKLNVGNDALGSPITKYEKTRAQFDEEEVKKVVKGKYGNNGNEPNRSTGL